MRYQPYGDAFFEQPVGHHGLLAFLVCGQRCPAAFLVEADCATGCLIEVPGADLTAVDHPEHEPVGDRGTEFFHHVQCQRGPPGPEAVQVPHLRVEPDAFECRFAFGAQERVAERQERVGTVARGPPAAPIWGERGAVCADHSGEYREVGSCCDAFEPAQRVEISSLTDLAEEPAQAMSGDPEFRFGTGGRADPLVVPVKAVGEDAAGRFVFVIAGVDQGVGTAQRRPVRIGSLLADGFVVEEGLAEGELVVTAGLRSLLNGMEVRLLER